jgi:hypothetical protein
MAITAAVCNSFKADILAAVHAAGDVYKIALFTSSATLSKATTAYSSTGEVTGTGYTAGGQTLVGYTPGASGDVAWLDWTTDPSWATATITARGALIYNSSKSNKAVAVLDFGSDITSTAATFLVTLPTADASNAVVRVGP